MLLGICKILLNIFFFSVDGTDIVILKLVLMLIINSYISAWSKSKFYEINKFINRVYSI